METASNNSGVLCSKVRPARLSSREAVALIPNNATIAVSGFAIMGLSNSLHRALVERFLETGAPRDLTYIHAAGHLPSSGMDLLAPHDGLVRKVIGGHWGLMPALREKISAEKIEAHNWPQGVIVGAFRAAATGEKNGLRSRIGVGTFIDPRQSGGCANQTAREAGSLIRLVEQDGEEFLNYAPIAPDVALVRGWSVDKLGNVSLGMEPLNLSSEMIAMATRNRGGKVFCQVRFIEDDVIYPSHKVAIPGFLIDALVVSDNPETEHRQCEMYDVNPALVNESESGSGAGVLPAWRKRPPFPMGRAAGLVGAPRWILPIAKCLIWALAFPATQSVRPCTKRSVWKMWSQQSNRDCLAASRLAAQILVARFFLVRVWIRPQCSIYITAEDSTSRSWGLLKLTNAAISMSASSMAAPLVAADLLTLRNRRGAWFFAPL